VLQKSLGFESPESDLKGVNSTIVQFLNAWKGLKFSRPIRGFKNNSLAIASLEPKLRNKNLRDKWVFCLNTERQCISFVSDKELSIDWEDAGTGLCKWPVNRASVS
jgi:hypothetical protein